MRGTVVTVADYEGYSPGQRTVFLLGITLMTVPIPVDKRKIVGSAGGLQFDRSTTDPVPLLSWPRGHVTFIAVLCSVNRDVNGEH